VSEEKQQDMGASTHAVRHWSDWHEDYGPVLWWLWPIEQPPYVGSPLDLGFTVEIDVAANSSCGGYAGGTHRMRVGGWPFGGEDDERRTRLWWTPLPDCDALDRAIRSGDEG
jgi:hypothetical protein